MESYKFSCAVIINQRCLMCCPWVSKQEFISHASLRSLICMLTFAVGTLSLLNFTFFLSFLSIFRTTSVSTILWDLISKLLSLNNLPAQHALGQLTRLCQEVLESLTWISTFLNHQASNSWYFFCLEEGFKVHRVSPFPPDSPPSMNELAFSGVKSFDLVIANICPVFWLNTTVCRYGPFYFSLSSSFFVKPGV